MNILVIAPHGMYQDYTSSFVHHQAKAYVAAGHRVRVLVPLAIAKRSNEGRRFGPLVEIFEQDGVELCYLRHLSLGNYGIRHFNTPSALLALRMNCAAVLRDFAPDVIHAHTLRFCCELGIWLKKKLHCPLVITTHGGDTELSVLPKALEQTRRICDQADAVVAVSEKLAAKVRSAGSATPVLRIWNGFAVQNCRPAEKRLGSIVQAGSLQPLKHNDYTLQAVAKLFHTYPELTLTVIGSGPERPRLEELSAQLGLDRAVSFMGQRPNQEVLSEMGKAQFFVMPSYPEGFGIVYLEAMASGCVTIGTEGEGISDFIVHGENGFLVPKDDVAAIADVIARCLRHPEEAAAVAERGRQAAMRLTWEENAAQYIALFSSLR